MSGRGKKDVGEQTARDTAAHVRGEGPHQNPEVDGNVGCWGTQDGGHCEWSSPVTRVAAGDELGCHGGSGHGGPGWQ